ncbi:uncharacterized protein LAESUDRAFT_743264 [Laetiporus sulphureus 93-53]|uniref:Aminoglycoside phosphotransferase domain-containing protein n=1 Tax=Laetiporus sulphureus 93-53 TaxID=1314785 RepID=A0A165EBL2_9APHY|nr:uncharacterized protein LAESUDRAFT_743264 [Laetiporus sulphureus 93-53]KZT06674.1 hypothetical protein LAESUDRAFT_743264 [Laetiporus sulphureus 93-53]
MQTTLSETLRSLQITLEQAQRVISAHRRTTSPVSAVEEFKHKGYSAFTPIKTFVIILADGAQYTLKISPPAMANMAPVYAPNTLNAEHAFLQLLVSRTNVPVPIPYALDTTLSLLPYPYLLLSRPRGLPLSHLRVSGTLTPPQSLKLDLRAGAYLRELHDLENEWFGLPAQEREGIYNWQEAFTGLIEGLLEEAQARGIPLPYEDVRKMLSRAIGFFLFDDCEVPALVSFAGDEDMIYVDVDAKPDYATEYADESMDEDMEDVDENSLVKSSPDDELPITSFLSFSHALWGDPLLEAMFLDPSAALLEGHGGQLIIFPRHKTKRLWYTFFLALMVLVQAKRQEEVGLLWVNEDKAEWARRTLDQCVRDLKDAPCY